jgi:hypothetical protein
MRRNALHGVCLAVALGIVGCQDQKTEPSAPTAPGAELGQSNAKATLLRAPAKVRVVDEHLNDAAGHAINPNDYVCGNEVSAVSDWLDGEIARTDVNNLFDLYFNWAADQVTFADGEYFLTTATPQSFGYTGEFTQTMLKTEKDVKRFWDIPSAKIQMVAAHGTMLQDVNRVANVYESLFTDGGQPIPHSSALLFAGIVRNEVLADPALAGGNHPLFSFNAVAFPGDPDFNAGPKIVMGDGVLEGFNAVGLGDVAPQGVFAHEFGHHIQFANGYFDEDPPTNDPGHIFSGAEFTRYTELMADAFAGYYLTHARGAALRQKRVEQFLQVYFQLGDCAFTQPGHHGTPNQRMAAARFGFKVAADAQKQGIILTSQAFHTLFRAAYTQITAPDAT